MQTHHRKRLPCLLSSCNTGDLCEVLCVNKTSCNEQEEKKRDPVGDAAAKAGFINTDGLFVFPHRLVLHVPTQRFACQTLQVLNRFDNNGLRSHETRTEFLGDCANMFAKCPNNNASTAFSTSLFCLMLLQLPMLHFSAVILNFLNCETNCRTKHCWHRLFYFHHSYQRNHFGGARYIC